MDHDERIKALNAVIRSINEENLALCREELAYEEARGNTLSADYYREGVVRLEAKLGISDASQGA